MKIVSIIVRQSADVLPRSLSDFAPYFVGRLIGKKPCFVIRNPRTELLEGINYQSGKIISVGIHQESVKFI